MSIDFFVNTCRLHNKELQKTFKGHTFLLLCTQNKENKRNGYTKRRIG